MAKTNKNKQTLEEKLQQALVPKEEQPYEIPDNWVWVRLDLFSKKAKNSFVDGPFGSNLKASDYTLEGIRLVQLQNIKELSWDDSNKIYTSISKAKELYKHKAFPGDIVIAKMAYPIARATILPAVEESFIVVADCVKLSVHKLLNTEYVELVVNSPQLRQQAELLGKGSTRQRINLGDLRSLKTPFPPIKEQIRIMQKVNNLRVEINEAKQLIEEAKESFEMRRASILNKAFTGELTAKWRETNSPEPAIKLLEKINDEKLKKWEEECLKATKEGKKKPKKPVLKPVEEMIIPKEEQPYEIPDGWEWVRLGDLGEDFKYGYTAKSNVNGNVKLLRITDIQNDSVSWDSVPYCVIEKNKLANYLLKKGDLVVARTGATTGKSFLIDVDTEAIFASYLIRLRFNLIDASFVKIFMQSEFYWSQVMDFSSGIAQPGVNATKLGQLLFPLSPIDEQIEMQRNVKYILESENKAKELLDMESQIELIEKSILYKAFRGELGTNDNTDEPAIELLKRVLSEGD